MEELWLAMALMAALSIVVFFVTRRLVTNVHPRLLDGFAVVIVLLVGVYVRLVWGQLWIVKWIPMPSVIVLANWFPALLGALAGVLWERTKSQKFIRRLPSQVLLIGATVWSELYVIPWSPLECGEEWIEPTAMVPFRICRQTTVHTCSAAAAATILTSLGIQTSEKEMAALCLTKAGTTWLGLYHGLSVRLRGTGLKAEFFECSVQELDRITEIYPALLCCRLDADIDDRFPVYRVDRGWVPGVSHSTVLFGHDEPFYLIGDPSQKDPELWSANDIGNLWTGTGLRIVNDTAGRGQRQNP